MAPSRSDRIGRWTLRRRLKSGGNGVVWTALDAEGEVAIKILHPWRSRGEPWERFRREVDFQRARSGQPGILPLIDAYLPDAPSDDDPAWLAMPRATPIRDSLGPNPGLVDVLEAMRQIAAPLTRLAAEGVSHRDIKPENLFDYEGQFVVGDFGLIHVPGEERLTGSKKAGPAFYIAPEMANNPDRADGRKADVYSWAKTLWVLACAKDLPPGGQHRVDDEIYRLSNFVSGEGIPYIERLLERATDSDPERRPTIAECGGEVSAVLEQRRGSKMADETRDLGAIADEINALTEPAQRQFNALHEARIGFRDDWQRIRERVLLPLVDRIKGLGIAGAGEFANSQVFEGWGLSPPQAPEILEQASGSAHVSTPGAGPDLSLALGARLFPDDRVYLGAVVRVGDSYAGTKTLWVDEEVARRGSAAFELAAERLGHGLREHLRDALEFFLGRLALRRDQDRYAVWGGEGEEPGQFRAPHTVIASEDGCYVVDTHNNRVQRFGVGGAFVLSWERTGLEPKSFSYPAGGCRDFEGNIWVVDQDNQRLLQFTPSGEFRRVVGPELTADLGLEQPSDCAVDPAGQVFIADRGLQSIVKLDRAGRFEREWGGEGREAGEFASPLGVAVELGRFVYVADTGNDRVQKFTVEGEFVAAWGSEAAVDERLHGPHAVALDRAENVYVADSGHHRIQVFDSDGKRKYALGAGGGSARPGTRDAEFTMPRGVDVDTAGNVYVADTNNNRIHRFGPRFIEAL